MQYWILINPPWHRGFCEKLVGLIKQSLRKVLGRAFVTLPVLQTIVVENEATLNDHPLTYVSTDVTDMEPLTPAHLLCGRRITSSRRLDITNSQSRKEMLF